MPFLVLPSVKRPFRYLPERYVILSQLTDCCNFHHTVQLMSPFAERFCYSLQVVLSILQQDLTKDIA